MQSTIRDLAPSDSGSPAWAGRRTPGRRQELGADRLAQIEDSAPVGKGARELEDRAGVGVGPLFSVVQMFFAASVWVAVVTVVPRGLPASRGPQACAECVQATQVSACR